MQPENVQNVQNVLDVLDILDVLNVLNISAVTCIRCVCCICYCGSLVGWDTCIRCRELCGVQDKNCCRSLVGCEPV